MGKTWRDGPGKPPGERGDAVKGGMVGDRPGDLAGDLGVTDAFPEVYVGDPPSGDLGFDGDAYFVGEPLSNGDAAAMSMSAR